VFGHYNDFDGITYDTESISFTTLHGAAGAATAKYYPENMKDRTFHVVGVHSESKNELFVDGERVASVDLTPEQLMAGYSITSFPASLYIGRTSIGVIVDAPAVYGEALTLRQAKLHYLWGRNVPTMHEVVTKRGGFYWDFHDSNSQVALDFRFDTDKEWSDSQAAGVSIENDILRPSFGSDGLTLAGTWQAGFILPAIVDTVDGSKIEFEADGTVKIQTSINNGATWSTAINGREITGLGKGTLSTGKTLMVRAVFTAGEPADTIAKVNHLSIKIYKNRDSQGTLSNRPMIFTGKVGLASVRHQPIEYHDLMGVDLYSGGYATTTIATTTRVLELWFKPVTSTPFTLFDGAGTGTLYVNGVANSSPVYEADRWYHVVFVSAASLSGSTVNINPGGLGEITVGMVATYPSVMTAAQVSELYGAYLGIPSATVVESTGLNVSDAATQTVKIYSYDWSVVGSG
jgi:hypothetical protein